MESLAEELHGLLAGPHAEIRDRVLIGLTPYASVLTDAEELDTDAFRDRVRDVVVELAGSELTGLGFPREYGGGGDIGASIAAFETVAHGDLSVLVKVGVQFGLFGGAILHLGTKRHHDAYLADLVAGRLLGCFAMTEHGHGSNVAALDTVATFDPDTAEFVITTTAEDAYKDYIGNAARHAELAVVFAQLDVPDADGEPVRHGVHAFVARIREDGQPVPGVRIADDGLKMGLNGVDNGRLWFDGLRVPRENLLDRFADVSPEGVYTSEIESVNKRFFTMLGTLIQGRVSVGGAAVTTSKVALTVATRYALARRQFEGGQDEGAPEAETLLLDYGQHQRRLFPLLARSYALTFAQEVLVGQLHASFSGLVGADEAEVFRRELESRAAGTKAIATWHATRTIQECREACGGAGYLAANRFAALKADTDVFTTFEGDNTVLMQLVAKGLLTSYSSEFSSMDQLDLVRFVAGQAVDTVVEKASVHKLLERVRDLLPGGSSDDVDVREDDYHLAMLRFREEHMLAGVARRLKGGMDDGTAPGVVFSHVQDHVIALGHAHVERLVHEAFVDRLATVPEGEARDLLTEVAHLHALTTIEADRAWWMEHGRLTVQRSKAITAEINRICRSLRPHARTLVDAFGIPEAFLRAEELI